MHKIILILFSCISISAFAQIGGKNSFEFLNTSHTSRLSALGGVNVSLNDRDVNFFANNPALTGDTLSGFASANYQFYVGDIGQAFFSYAHNFNTVGLLAFGVHHIQYGTIQGYDATGVETTSFNSGETAFIISKQHQVSNFRLGVNLKGAFSNIAGYRGSAVLVDIGGVFIHPTQPFTAGLVIKNVGIVLGDYTAEKNSKLPFDVQLGATFKPEHMPLRFSLSAYNLTTADVTYADPDDKKPGGVSKVLSHVTMGTEILVHKNVTIMAGYNYLVHQALKLTGGGGGAGISLGFAAAIRSFEFGFSRSAYVAGNAGYSFTLSTNVNKILKRR